MLTILVSKEGGKDSLMKLFKSRPPVDEDLMKLKNNLMQTSDELRSTYTNLENVVDPDLIDYYIYHAKAVQMRYKYLLESVKKIEDSYAKNPLL